MTCGKEYSDPSHLNAETIPLAGILVPRRIELKVNYGSGGNERQEGMSYIVLPAFALLFEQTCSDRCDAGVVQKVTGKVIEEIY